LCAIWFADTDRDSNCNSNSRCDCHTYGDRDSYCNNDTEIYTGSAIQAYSSAAPVATPWFLAEELPLPALPIMFRCAF
jgi:hypothetical protein